MTQPILPFSAVYAEIEDVGVLSAATARRSFDMILQGVWSPVQVAGFLVALRSRPDSADVIAAAVESMRAAMIVVDHGLEEVLDTCGTGGDGQGTLNLSTAAALLVASTGVVVAKHGNRAVSSRAGSADVLEQLGIPLDTPASASADLLREVGIAFLMAPVHHPAMKHATPVRRELGIRTVFNVLGPLANPARATHQLVGCYSEALRPVLAETLAALGTRRAWVVRGADGLDEISPFMATKVTELSQGKRTELEIHPEDFGIAASPEGAIRGGDANANARAIEAVLDQRPHPATDAFVLNAAAALVVARGGEPKAATDRIRQVISDGTARRKLQAWREAAQARRVVESE